MVKVNVLKSSIFNLKNCTCFFWSLSGLTKPMHKLCVLQLAPKKRKIRSVHSLMYNLFCITLWREKKEKIAGRELGILHIYFLFTSSFSTQTWLWFLLFKELLWFLPVPCSLRICKPIQKGGEEKIEINEKKTLKQGLISLAPLLKINGRSPINWSWVLVTTQQFVLFLCFVPCSFLSLSLSVLAL